MRKERSERPIGGRLNDVRQLVGAKDVKAFYESLRGERLRGFPSLATAYTYHGKPWRDPSTIYLARILETYPQVNPEWLLTGEGPRTRAEVEADRIARRDVAEVEQPVTQIFRAGLPHVRASGLAEAMLWRLWAPLREALRERARVAGNDVSDDALGLMAAELVVKALRAPLDVLGPFHAHVWAEDYVIAMSEPLRALAEREANWIRDLRGTDQERGA